MLWFGVDCDCVLFAIYSYFRQVSTQYRLLNHEFMILTQNWVNLAGSKSSKEL